MTINNVLRALVLAVAATFLGIVVWNLRDATVHAGDRAPQFSIRTEDGQTVTPTNFGGKVLVLNFWATWCLPCVDETPTLNAFQQKYRDQGVVVLAISIDKNAQKYKRFLERFHATFEAYRDPGAGISARYGTFQYPETYIIKDGRVLKKYVSEQDWMSADIDQYVQSLL